MFDVHFPVNFSLKFHPNLEISPLELLTFSMQFLAFLKAEKSQTSPVTALDKATCAARIVFLVVGIFTSLSITVKLTYPYLLALLSSTSLPQLSSLARPSYIFIAIIVIIFIIRQLHYDQPLDLLSTATFPFDQSDHLSLDSTNETVNNFQESSSPAGSAKTKKCMEEDDTDATWTRTNIMNTDASASTTSSSNQSIKSKKRHLWPPPQEQDEETQEKDIHATWMAIMKSKSSATKNLPIKKRYKHNRPVLARAAGGLPVENQEAEVESKKKRNKKMEEEVRKTNTLNQSAQNCPASVGWRRRDVLVMSNGEEFFRRIEAFIKLNYAQRRESHEQHRQRVEMMSVAA